MKNLEEEKRLMIEEYYPIFQVKYVGKYFKRKKSFSGMKPYDSYWYIYTRVYEITKEHIYRSDDENGPVMAQFNGYSFETKVSGSLSSMQNGSVWVHPIRGEYISMIGEEISEKEFYDARENMLSYIMELK